MFRVGVLSLSARSHEGFRTFVVPELARRGFAEGRNLELIYRAGPLPRLPELAEALVGERPDAIFAVATPSALALRRATTTIPIVLFGGEDAVSEGLAATLSQPGGNVTGVVILSTSLNPKRMELLQEVLPGVQRLGVLLFSGSPVVDALEHDVRAAAAKAGFEVVVALAGGPDEYPGAFRKMVDAGVRGVVIGAGAQFFADADALLSLASNARLPTACEWAEMAQQGCLIGYGPRRAPIYQVAARKLSEVLQGTPPSKLPIERPAFFDLAINVKVAHSLGVTLPATLVSRADEVIE